MTLPSQTGWLCTSVIVHVNPSQASVPFASLAVQHYCSIEQQVIPHCTETPWGFAPLFWPWWSRCWSMGARRQDANHLYMVFRQVIGIWFSLRNSPSFEMKKVFPSENHSGYPSKLFLKLSTPPLYRCPLVSMRSWWFYQAQPRSICVSCAGSVPWLLPLLREPIRRLSVVLLSRRSPSLLPATRLRSYSQSLSLPTAFSKTRSALQCFQTFADHLEHVFQDFYILVANISLKFANSFPGIVLNCFLITRETSCFFFLSNPRFNFKSSDFFSPCS